MRVHAHNSTEPAKMAAATTILVVPTYSHGYSLTARHAYQWISRNNQRKAATQSGNVPWTSTLVPVCLLHGITSQNMVSSLHSTAVRTLNLIYIQEAEIVLFAGDTNVWVIKKLKMPLNVKLKGYREASVTVSFKSHMINTEKNNGSIFWYHK